ncbi:hypothetical protein MRB53_013925 [Persea americana]|uniref:Uncharacterized protein n=1 Tax=Persea americana TaxID=3435 RepID=A0ACC2K9C0_PERAE|nr:hypothetical protein MRB53_013925 [Persea americana]
MFKVGVDLWLALLYRLWNEDKVPEGEFAALCGTNICLRHVYLPVKKFYLLQTHVCFSSQAICLES